MTRVGLVASVVMLTSGLGIPVMAAFNARLAAALQNPVAAAGILFVVALVAILPFLLLSELPTARVLSGVPWFVYLGGLFVTYYLLAIAFSVPHIGVGNAVFLVLVGQIVAATLIDQFGLFGARQIPMNWTRLLGIGLMVTGVILARRTG